MQQHQHHSISKTKMQESDKIATAAQTALVRDQRPRGKCSISPVRIVASPCGAWRHAYERIHFRCNSSYESSETFLWLGLAKDGS